MSIVKRKTVFIFTTPSGPWDNVEKNKPKIEHMHHFELNDIREIFKDANVTILNPHTRTVGRRGEPMAHWVYYITVEPVKFQHFTNLTIWINLSKLVHIRKYLPV